jgi:hypothetical protein
VKLTDDRKKRRLSALLLIGTKLSIHDIGKIYVPAEILSKPGKLSYHEFNILQDTHEYSSREWRMWGMSGQPESCRSPIPVSAALKPASSRKLNPQFERLLWLP